MFTQPIDENDPLYYEKESARLMQEQAMCAINLADAFAKALPPIIEKMHRELELRVWTVLIGKEAAEQCFAPDQKGRA